MSEKDNYSVAANSKTSQRKEDTIQAIKDRVKNIDKKTIVNNDPYNKKVKDRA